MFSQIFGTLGSVVLISAGLTGEISVVMPHAVQNQYRNLQDPAAAVAPAAGPGRSALTSGRNGVSAFHYALAVSLPADETENKKDTGYILQKVKEWREATLLHNPGEADQAAREIGGWHQEDLEIVLDFLTDLASQSEKSVRRTVARTPIRNRLQLTADEARLGDLNRLLKQGALLHTDIALLGLETGQYLSSGEPTVMYLDGRIIAQPKRNIHWNYARRLLNSVAPSPSKDAMVRQWYIATTAYLQRRRLLAYARVNIENALDLFPDDDRILFYAGALHETWALPASQNAFLPQEARYVYDSKKSELKEAGKLYRKAIKANPDFSENHLRLGRILLLQDNPHKAYVELSIAQETLGDPQLSYYASLYTGLALEKLSRRDQAAEQYEQAATLYPAAQSPLLALSHLARNNDDMEDAILAMQRVFELPLEDNREDDPWWNYDLSHVRDADILIRDMQHAFGELPR